MHEVLELGLVGVNDLLFLVFGGVPDDAGNDEIGELAADGASPECGVEVEAGGGGAAAPVPDA